VQEPGQEVQAAVVLVLVLAPRLVPVFLAAVPVGSGPGQVADPGAGVRDDDDGVGVAAAGGSEGPNRGRRAEVAGEGGRGGVEVEMVAREERGEVAGGEGRHDHERRLLVLSLPREGKLWFFPLPLVLSYVFSYSYYFWIFYCFFFR
jgi:hypothetical protein